MEARSGPRAPSSPGPAACPMSTGGGTRRVRLVRGAAPLRALVDPSAEVSLFALAAYSRRVAQARMSRLRGWYGGGEARLSTSRGGGRRAGDTCGDARVRGGMRAHLARALRRGAREQDLAHLRRRRR